MVLACFQPDDFFIMDFRAGYSSTGEPQKITMYSPGRRRQFYNFIVSNGTFLILVKLSITYYESWYLVPSFEKTYSKCSSLLSSSEPNSAWQASPWGHSPSSSAPCAVPMRLSRIDQHIKDEPCAKQRALLGVFSSRFSSVSQENRSTYSIWNHLPLVVRVVPT